MRRNGSATDLVRDARHLAGRARRGSRRRLRAAMDGLAGRPAPAPTPKPRPKRPYRTFYGSADTKTLIERWSVSQPEQVESPYFRTHAGRFAYLVACLGAMEVTGDCIDVAGTSRTKLLLEDMTDLTSVTLTPEVDVEIDDWADRFGVGSYDVAIFSEVIEHLNADPAKAIHEINRSLRPGGWLLLTTVNIASELGIWNLANGEAPYAMGNIFGERGDRHQREYAPAELQRLVAAHGFRTWATTVNVYAKNEVKKTAHRWMKRQEAFDLRNHGDTVVVIARKEADSPAPYRLHPIYHGSVSTNRRDQLAPDLVQRLEPDWPWPAHGPPGRQ